jgi:2-haloacid dehalogenase
MMCAAHNRDLKAAKAQGMATAFIPRRTEHGPCQTTDLEADRSVADVAASDFVDLAKQLGC